MNINHNAFTLVELVAAIVLCAILTALLMPTMQRARGPCRSSCLNHVRQIGLAFKQYAVDNNGSFPGIGASNNPVTSTSVFLSLTNGNYLSSGKVYLCPSDMKKIAGSPGNFTTVNNSYAYVVADAAGTNGLSEAGSSDQPLIFDEGVIGAPGWVIGLTHAFWKSTSAHKGDGGYVFYVAGQAGFKKKFDTGSDGTNGYVVVP